MNINVTMKYDELTFILNKNDYTNEFFIPKLSEDSPFQVSKMNHYDRNNYQVTFF